MEELPEVKQQLHMPSAEKEDCYEIRTPTADH
jgi:hypothetical protein